MGCTVLQEQGREVHSPAPWDRNEMRTSKLGYECNLLYYFLSLFKSWDRNHTSFITSRGTWFWASAVLRGTHFNTLSIKGSLLEISLEDCKLIECLPRTKTVVIHHQVQLLPESSKHQLVWHYSTDNTDVFTPRILEGIYLKFIKSTTSFSGYWYQDWTLLGGTEHSWMASEYF